MSTVDILIPHFGPLAVVQTAVRSVLAQTDEQWRLTVVDDTGDSADAALSAWITSLGDPRVRYVRNAANLGINRNFQQCVDLVEHELAVIMGCDDVLLPRYVAVVREAHRRSADAAMVQPGVQVIDDSGAPSRSLVDTAKARVYAPRATTTVLSGEQLAASVLRGNWTYFPSICWRADALKAVGFREGLDIVLDLALILDLALAGHRLVVEPTPAFQYRRHRSSLSSVQAGDARRFAEERRFFLDAAERLTERGWPRAAAAARRHVSSRLNAALLIPSSLLRRDVASARRLARHVGGRPSGPATT